jgi:hypothetical protein
MIIVSSGTGTVTNINTTAPLSGGPITTSGAITTAMATNKLIGRSTAGIGVMEEITLGTGLNLSGGILSSTGGALPAGNTNEIQFNNGGAFAASSNLDWIIADNRLLLGSENTADVNSRMVIIGKGISTNNTFVVHNSTGTNNSLIVRDDGRVNIGGGRLHVGNASATGRIWFGNAASPTGANNGYIDLDSTSSASGSICNIPGTDSNNETTRLTITQRDRSDGIRFYPAITAGSSTNVGKAVIGKSTGAGLTFGLDFRFYGSVSVGTIGQNEAYRFYSYDATTGTPSNILRFQVGNGAAVANSIFVNSQIGITDNATITVDASSVLDIQSTTKGVLLPRLTTTEINNIVSPATGLTVYNTTVNTLCFYNGSSWQKCNHSNL